MAKENARFSKRLIHWFTYHPWLKLIALMLAILVWLYVKSEINRFNF